MAQAFRDAVDAAPLERRLPPCDRPLANVYEQVPISGKNCLPVREDRTPNGVSDRYRERLSSTGAPV